MQGRDVAGGEQNCNLGQFRLMIRDRYVNVIHPDLVYNRGLICTLQWAKWQKWQASPLCLIVRSLIQNWQHCFILLLFVGTRGRSWSFLHVR